MLKRATITVLLFLLLASAAVVYVTIHPCPAEGDVGATKGGVTQVGEEVTGEEPRTIQQMRNGGSKDFWIHDQHIGRMHHRIESSHSVLTAQEGGKQLHFTEQIFNMKGYIQEKVERDNDMQPVQHVRYIESEEGLYQYFDRHFEAENILLALFRVPGTTLPLELSPDEAFLRGVAEGASLSLAGRTPNFHAQMFRADVQQPNPSTEGSCE